MSKEFKTFKEIRTEMLRLGEGWTYDCVGENLGTPGAIITGYIPRRMTADERKKSQENLAALTSADLDSRTPLNGGRS